jgi:cellulose synthase operon protein C
MLTTLCRLLLVSLIAGVTATFAAAARANEADDQFALAAGNYDRQQWQLAVENFQRFLEKQPTDRRANQSAFFLGEALIQLGKLDDAREYFRQYASRDPKGKYVRVALFRAAESAYLAGRFDVAKPELDAFLVQYPDDRLGAYVLPYLGDIALRKNDPSAAAQFFRDGLKRFPEGRLQDDCRFGLGRSLEKQNKNDEAEQLYVTVAGKADSPLADSAQFYLGALHYAAGQYDKAVESFAVFESRFAASALQPNARLGLGLTLLKLNRPGEAPKQFDAVLATESADGNLYQQAMRGKAEAHLTLGSLLFSQKKYADAIAPFEAFLQENDPADDVAVVKATGELALCYAHTGRLDKAQELYSDLVKTYPNDSLIATMPELLAEAIYEWAWVLQDRNDSDEAGRAFERLRKEYPQSRLWADATCRLARLALEAKDYAAATALVDKVLTRKTASEISEYAMFLRGEIAVAKNDWPEAAEAFTALLREYPKSQRRLVAEFWVAESYYRQADLAEAGPRFEQLVEKIKGHNSPWIAMIPLRRAQVLARQNQWSEANAIAAGIAANFPNFDQQYEVDYLLGRCLANQADFAEAREAYGRVISSPAGAKTETAAMAQWMIGETYFHQKDYKTAYREYLKIDIHFAFPTWQAGALLQAGKCRELLGESKEADELYQRVVTAYPKTTFANIAGQRLKSPAAVPPSK